MHIWRQAHGKELARTGCYACMWAYLPLQAYFTCTKDNVSINTLVLQRQRIQISELQIVMHTNAHTCARPPGHYKYQEERHPPRHPCLRGKMGIYNHTLHYMLLASRCKHFMQLNLSKPDVLLPVPLSTLFRSRFQAKPATFLIPMVLYSLICGGGVLWYPVQRWLLFLN